MTILIHKGPETLKHEMFLFPAGEVGIKLDAHNYRYRAHEAPYQTIVARLKSANDIMELILLTDALRRWDPTPVRLFMPYVPYARQDRVCVKGEPFSLKAFAGLINAQGYERVTVVDPHSDVTGAVFDRLTIITQFDVINRYQDFLAFMTPNSADRPLLVSPDAGANKKTSELATYFARDSFLRADKLRDLATGKIKETVVYADDLSGCTAVICDDLCDGGRTFTELARVLKAKGAAKVVLYVTHGIFSKGVEALTKGGIDDIYTTDSFTTMTGGLKALKLTEAFPL